MCMGGGGEGGGELVNPQALLTAMQQEKAVLVNKSIDEV